MGKRNLHHKIDIYYIYIFSLINPPGPYLNRPEPWRFSNPGFELSLFFSCLITTLLARCNLNQQLRHALNQIRQPVFIPSHQLDKVALKVETCLIRQFFNPSCRGCVSDNSGQNELWAKINPDLQLNGREPGEMILTKLLTGSCISNHTKINWTLKVWTPRVKV